MAIRTILAPGVQINEIDKSGYSPAMVGTTVYLKGFAGKGEPYKFMEITTRTAFEQIYGAPDTEAERYFYTGACETLNQGGRLYAARLPYDNAAFEKMVGIKYVVNYGKNNISSLSAVGEQILSIDSEISDVAFIEGGKTPALYDLSSIDEFRTDEAKVPADTFLIVDTTNATYAKVTEDERIGFKREVIGIIPVVTTAANALYAQNYINCELSDVQKYEPLKPGLLCTLIAKDADGNTLVIDGQEMKTNGLCATDLTMNIAMGDTFYDHTDVTVNILSVALSNYTESLAGCWHECPELFDKYCFDKYHISSDSLTSYSDAVVAYEFITQNYSNQEMADAINEYNESDYHSLSACDPNKFRIYARDINTSTPIFKVGYVEADQARYAAEIGNLWHEDIGLHNKYTTPTGLVSHNIPISNWTDALSALHYVKQHYQTVNILSNLSRDHFYLDAMHVWNSIISTYNDYFKVYYAAIDKGSEIGDLWSTLPSLRRNPRNHDIVASNGRTAFENAILALDYVKEYYDFWPLTIGHYDINDYALLSSCKADGFSIVKSNNANTWQIKYTPMVPFVVTNDSSKPNYYLNANVVEILEANNYSPDGIAPLFGYHEKNYNDAVPNTIGLNAANYFPTIQPAVDGNGLDPEHLKDIGVVVYKAYLDPSEGNKVSLEIVEAFAGSLYKDDKDPNTGVTKFIDKIINSQSKYINFFSNCFSSTNSKKYYKDECDMLYIPPATGACLGLYSPMTKKDISISKSILDGLNKCFDKVADINLLDIDIVPDAGVSNIASYIKAIFGEKGPYDLSITDSLGNSLLGMWTCKKATDDHVKMWKTILMKYDNFCKNIRKDCMFTADGLRPLVLAGQKKIVRDTKPSNSIDKDILPFLPAICGLNSSYGAGYADWFEQADDYTGDFFWCPPSIKAMGCYINTDVNYDYWLAPAGLTRGIIAATDVAFSPNAKQAGSFYEKNWNYAINYPQDGIVLEGQKTFQTKPTALDRVNVRRTMLRLERQVYKILRYFVYENNTAYTRQRVIDAIEPVLKACWQGGNGGLNRYKIVCDEKINDANTIDNNELKVQIGVVPNKSAEFILCDFIIGAQSSTWAELLG